MKRAALVIEDPAGKKPSNSKGHLHELVNTRDWIPFAVLVSGGLELSNPKLPFLFSGSRATSVKAEPGSALESNLESNASVSASVQAVKMASPGFIATSSRASGGLHEQVIESTDSSMCSLLKSSDDFTPTNSNGSEDDDKESGPARPTLPDPFWLTSVELTPQLTLSYQIKLKKLSEVLKRDQEVLKNMPQPNQVKEQLAQLYRELEDTGEAIKPLLEADGTPSCTSTSSSSTGEECEETFTKTQKQRQVKFERYAIIYGEDAPMPPSLKKTETRKGE